jgi:hypothetical protein
VRPIACFAATPVLCFMLLTVPVVAGVRVLAEKASSGECLAESVTAERVSKISIRPGHRGCGNIWAEQCAGGNPEKRVEQAAVNSSACPCLVVVLHQVYRRGGQGDKHTVNCSRILVNGEILFLKSIPGHLAVNACSLLWLSTQVAMKRKRCTEVFWAIQGLQGGGRTRGPAWCQKGPCQPGSWRKRLTSASGVRTPRLCRRSLRLECWSSVQTAALDPCAGRLRDSWGFRRTDVAQVRLGLSETTMRFVHSCIWSCSRASWDGYCSSVRLRLLSKVR